MSLENRDNTFFKFTIAKTGIICVIFSIRIVTPSILLGQTNSGTILSEQRQEKAQRSLQNIKPTPPEEIAESGKKDTDPKTVLDKPKPDKKSGDAPCKGESSL